jgi:hypothetical protein
MFVDIVTTSVAEYEAIESATKLYSDPPEALLAAIVWEAEEPGQVTALHVWRSPGERGDFAMNEIMPLAQAGRVTSSPKRLRPVKVFLRS